MMILSNTSEVTCHEYKCCFLFPHNSLEQIIFWVCSDWLVRKDYEKNKIFKLKVIPLKLFYYQTFFETWRNEHS